MPQCQWIESSLTRSNDVASFFFYFFVSNDLTRRLLTEQELYEISNCWTACPFSIYFSLFWTRYFLSLKVFFSPVLDSFFIISLLLKFNCKNSYLKVTTPNSMLIFALFLFTNVSRRGFMTYTIHWSRKKRSTKQAIELEFILMFIQLVYGKRIACDLCSELTCLNFSHAFCHIFAP